MPRRAPKAKTFAYANLSEEAQERARENCRPWQTEHEWWDCVYEDAKRVGECLGVRGDDIGFSGFCSQGDGAWITGIYTHRNDAVDAVKKYAPQDTELHAIAEALTTFQVTMKLRFGACASARLQNINQCQRIDADFDDEEVVIDKFWEEVDKPLDEILSRFSQWIYKQLNAEYDYLSSDEAVVEMIEANAYTFTEHGEFV